MMTCSNRVDIYRASFIPFFLEWKRDVMWLFLEKLIILIYFAVKKLAGNLRIIECVIENEYVSIQ